MSLEKAFGKELAGDLRKETAEKLWEARKAPKSFDDVTNPEVLLTTETKEQFESIKKDIFGKLFKTEKFKENVSLLNDALLHEKNYTIESIRKEYDTKFEDILRNSPLTKEEKEKYLSTESMENMPLDDYLTLLKRLSGEAFYHVTRYGVRENTFTSTGGGHTTGKDSFVDSFTEVLKEKKIKDCTTTIISDEERAASLLNKELILTAKNEGESIDEQVDRLVDAYNTEYFLDRESAHFSYGKELHGMYGAENNYKFYFYFPVEYILQNDFYHSTRLGPEAQIGSGYIQNDRGIQQTRNDFEIFNFGEGVPINAGILCITKGVPVDPETGSQYVLQNGMPVKDEEGNFITPEHTINSEDYWEKYFTDHPEQKPSKVIYGSMYTRANTESEEIIDWAKSKEIHKQDEEKKKEFIEYRDSKKEEIRAIFKKVITKIYEENND